MGNEESKSIFKFENHTDEPLAIAVMVNIRSTYYDTPDTQDSSFEFAVNLQPGKYIFSPRHFDLRGHWVRSFVVANYASDCAISCKSSFRFDADDGELYVSRHNIIGQIECCGVFVSFKKELVTIKFYKYPNPPAAPNAVTQ